MITGDIHTSYACVPSPLSPNHRKIGTQERHRNFVSWCRHSHPLLPSSYAMEECLSSSCKANIGPTQRNVRGQFRLSEQQRQESQSCRVTVVRGGGAEGGVPVTDGSRTWVGRAGQRGEEGVTCCCCILHVFQMFYFSDIHTAVPVVSRSFENVCSFYSLL